jgi:hypothetical protein
MKTRMKLLEYGIKQMQWVESECGVDGERNPII